MASALQLDPPDASAVAAARVEGVSTPDCYVPGDAFVFVSPLHPVGGQPLRVLAVSSRSVDASLSVAFVADGTALAAPRPTGGPPYVWFAEVARPRVGKWRVTLTKDASCGGERTLADQAIGVSATPQAAPPAPRTALWPTRRMWNRSLENLYAAWVARLFDDAVGAQSSWTALHELLADRGRNVLYNHLGLGEDEQGMLLRPDCADLPYFLRAYFAFKLGLPFGFSRCTRGENGAPPQCSALATNEDPFPPLEGAPQPLPLWADPDRPPGGPWDSVVRRFAEFVRTVLADAAQSGAGRTAAADEQTDYYPVRLARETLRPGTIFADPYGHVLVLSGRTAQTATAAGRLFAVDAQPDGTVARKRFWRGNFLFALDPARGSAGFKRFRPVVRDRASGQLRRQTNAELGDFSDHDQYAAGVDGFYDKVEDVLSPEPLDPTRALLETVEAFAEQVEARVVSVENGRRFLAFAKGPIGMPDGGDIFETMGPWEDFATPSRDLRLLIAIDVARALPARVEARPGRFTMPKDAGIPALRAELEARLSRELAGRKFTYMRTDESKWTLTLADVVARASAFEMAYNPNECVERRWGAPPASEEESTCQAHPPEGQWQKMGTYRAWFHDRRRPLR